MESGNIMKPMRFMKSGKAILFAVLAAVLYSLMTPLSKLLMVSVPPVAEAGLLYLGAGIGMGILYLAGWRLGRRTFGPSVDWSDLKYILAMIVLDMAAPVFLLLGLSMSTPENVSLLNNFEIVATACVAAFFFHEKVGKRPAISICIITAACILLSLESKEALTFSTGSLFVLMACVCWGVENNCTSSLSGKDTRQIVIIKGLGSGTASLIVSIFAGERIDSLRQCIPILILGFFSVGLSVYFYVMAQSRIGAARTSACYAVSPFIGAALSLLIFREPPGIHFWIALVFMAIGVWLNIGV